MNMVFHSSDRGDLEPIFTRDSDNIGPQATLEFLVDEFAAVLGAKYAMHTITDVRVRHGQSSLRDSQFCGIIPSDESLGYDQNGPPGQKLLRRFWHE